MNGDFAVGNFFMLKPQGVRPVKIMLADIQEGHSFADCTAFPGAKMHNTHAMEEVVDGLKLTNPLVMTGQLKWLWIKRVAKNVTHTVPEALVKLA